MQRFQHWDIGILRVIFENRIQELDSFFIFITNTAAALAFGIPILMLLSTIFTKKKEIRRYSLMILVPVFLSAIIANILKYTINLPRPYEVYAFIEKLSVGGSPSFPSGHTADAFAFAVAVSLIYPKWYFILPGLIWATMVGYSRMSLGVHFPSDVIAGAIIGAACAYGYILFIKWKAGKSQPK
jgi:undecaprenyl-diphosphatase